MTITTDNGSTAQDPVAVYDIMRETANRWMAIYAARVTVGGLEDPAVQAIIGILDKVDAVDSRDLGAQLRATKNFRHRYEATRDVTDPA